MTLEFNISGFVPATPDEVYKAWLDSEKHSKMTGGEADVSDVIGASFHAWDEYIQGINLELEPGKRILQNWRTTEFEDTDEDSLLEVLFEPEEGQTRVTIHHSNLPDHGMQYKQGWVDSYFTPMQEYFNE